MQMVDQALKEGDVDGRIKQRRGLMVKLNGIDNAEYSLDCKLTEKILS